MPFGEFFDSCGGHFAGNRVIAHRGVHGPRVEGNSREALQAAVRYGIPAEFDVFFFDSGESCVHHGPLGKRSAKSLMAITPPRSLVRLSEALELVGGAIPLLIELKFPSIAAARTIDSCLEMIGEYRGRVAITSFDVGVLRLRPRLGSIPLGLLSVFGGRLHDRDVDFTLLQKDVYALRGASSAKAAGLWTFPSLRKAFACTKGTPYFAIADVSSAELERATPRR